MYPTATTTYSSGSVCAPLSDKVAATSEAIAAISISQVMSLIPLGTLTGTVCQRRSAPAERGRGAASSAERAGRQRVDPASSRDRESSADSQLTFEPSAASTLKRPAPMTARISAPAPRARTNS